MSTQQALRKSFFIFLLPMMLSNVLQALSGTINNIYLGQMIGVEALAAATVFFPVLFLFISFIMGLGMGATVLVGQAYGAGNMDRLKTITGTALALTLSAGIVIAVLGSLYARNLLQLFNTPPDILEAAVSYARVMMWSMPLLFVFLLATSLLRGVGDAVTPLITLALSAAVGLVLTPVFIRGWFGAPRLGVASAAWASWISVVIALSWLGWKLRARKHPIAPDMALLRKVRFDWTILKLVLRIGIPTGVQMIIISLAEMVLLGLVNGFGSDATAAYGAFNQVMAYVQFPAMSIAITVSILGAQAIGRGHVDQLGLITRTGIFFNLVMTGALVLLCYIFSRNIVGFFITSPPVVELAQESLHIVLWSAVIFGMQAVFSAMMRASGTVLAPTLLAISAIALVEVPVAWFLSRRIGLDGIWAAYPAVFAAMLILQSSWYRFVWRKGTITRLV